MVIGRQRTRQAVGGEHGEHDGQAERGEQILRRPIEEDDRGEHATDGSVETRVGTAMPAEPCRVACGSGMPSSVSRRCVFSIGDRGVVDQDADRQGQAAQRHGVERLAQEEQAR